MKHDAPMTLLEDYATESLKIIARRRGWREAGAAGKAGLIEFLQPRLFSKEVNAQLIRTLPDRQKELLAALKARGGRADVVTLTASVEADAGEIALDIRELVEQGLLLYPPLKGGGRKHRLGECPRVYLDESAAAAVGSSRTRSEGPRLLAHEPAESHEAFPGLLLADMVLVLDQFRRHPVPPPEAGTAAGRAWRDISRRLLLPPADPPAEGRIAPRLAFIYALLAEMRLVVVHNGLLAATDETAGCFHSERQDLYRKVLDAWRRTQQWNEFHRIGELRARPTPDDSKGVHTPRPGQVARARDKVMAALGRFKAGHWYAFSSLIRELKQHDPDFLIRRDAGSRHGDSTYRGFGQRGRGDTALPLDLTTDWDKVEGRFLARLLLEPLHWLGLVRLGFEHGRTGDASTLDAFALTDQGAFMLGLTTEEPTLTVAGIPLLVQPDFTILCLAAEPDTGMLHDLTRFSDYDGGDRVARFTLSRESVQRGLHQGWSAADMGRVLSQGAGASLPQNVVASLGEWEAAYRRFRIVRGVTLIEDPHGLLRHLPPSSKLARHLGRQLTPGIYQPEGSNRQLQAALRQGHIQVRHMDYATSPGRVFTWEANSTIICSPRGDDWLTQGLLERLARPDEAHHGLWHLERSRVSAATAAGFTSTGLLEELSLRSRVVPPQVRLLLTAWGRERAAVSLAKVTLFSCQDGDLRQMILAVPELAAEVREQVSDDTFVIRPGRMTALRGKLRQYGITLRSDGAVRPQAPAPAARRQTPAASGRTLPFRWNRSEAAAGPDNGAEAATTQLRFLLLRAIQSRRRVRLKTMGPGERGRNREMAPLALDGAMLTASCLASGDRRTFSLDQIQAVELMPDRFTS